MATLKNQEPRDREKTKKNGKTERNFEVFVGKIGKMGGKFE